MVRFLFLFVFVSASAYGQKQGNIWYFGDGYGLDFNTTPPTLLEDGQTAPSVACGDLHIEGTASIADSSGSLLFYTDGQTIWNKNHQPMPNGTGLLGGSSSTQAVLIVPQPQSNTRYYVFTTDDFCNDLANGLRYSIVDICEDNKLGDVVEGFKNELLVDTVAEKLAAVRHANGIDYWLLTHRYFSNEFYAFQLTPQGIEPPVISAAGSVHEGGGANNMWRAMGQIKVSPQGSQLAIGSANCGTILELFGFDASSGIISNGRSLPSLCGAYGIAFSSDGTVLYETPFLTQYNLSAGGGNIGAISASAFQYSNSQMASFDGVQLGPDGKIYLYKNGDNVSVIHNPNLLGEASNAEPNAYSMPASAVYGLPAMVAGYDYTATGVCDTLIGINEQPIEPSIEIYPNPTTGEVRFKLHSGVSATGVEVYDMLGNKVMEMSFVNTMDVSRLPSGSYIIAVNTEEITYRQLLVVE